MLLSAAYPADVILMGFYLLSSSFVILFSSSTGQDELKALEIQAIIDGLNACLLVFVEPEKSETEKIIKGLEALKFIAI